MTHIIITPEPYGGPITSYRVAWHDGDRPVYVWRTDPGKPAVEFADKAEAEDWIARVWAKATPAEWREGGERWLIREVR